jgi:hypothetical protein
MGHDLTERDRAWHPGVLAEAIGRGLAAGVAGTAAMTVSSTLEARMRHRSPSTTPARAATAVLGVAPVDDRGERRFNQIVHWGYGTVWGGVHGVLAASGIGTVAATVAHAGAVWGAEQAVLPATDVASTANQWQPSEVALDLFHHAVYAAATAMAYRWLERR